MIRVLFIDDDPITRDLIMQELHRTPGFHCQTASDWPEAHRALAAGLADQVDVVLLDLGLPGPDGAVAARECKSGWPRLKILMFTMSDRREKILECLNAGADGYLLKTAPREELAAALTKVNGGSTALSPKVADELVSHFRGRQPLIAALSPTEYEVLQRLDCGQPYKQAASEMKISVETLKTHAKRILVKTLASSMNEAAWMRRQAQ